MVEASFSSPRQMAVVAVVHGVQGDLSDAARTNREMFEERRHALGAEHPDTLASAFKLGTLLGSQG